MEVAAIYDFSRHPYFVWMQLESTSRGDFRRSQLAFRFAVECFSQPLAAVLARFTTLEDRFGIVANLSEEHGHGLITRSHKHTFREYLLALGVSDDELNTPCSTAVCAFNYSILGFCLGQPGEVGAAMLGIIEYLYVNISAAIAQTITQRDWAIPGSQSHYTTHEKLDTLHAEDLFSLARSSWEEPRSRQEISQALVLGAYYFWSLYNGLLP